MDMAVWSCTVIIWIALAFMAYDIQNVSVGHFLPYEEGRWSEEGPHQVLLEDYEGQLGVTSGPQPLSSLQEEEEELMEFVTPREYPSENNTSG